MSNEVVVYKGKFNTLIINMGMDVSADTFSSEIRSEPNVDADLLATWTMGFLTDGEDGKLILTLNEADSAAIDVDSGYMDLKRISLTKSIPVFDRPLEVSIRGVVTA